MTYSDLLSERILLLAAERRWSIRRVAGLAELPYSTVNKIVLRERANPSVLTVHCIAKAFGMDIVEFLDFEKVRGLTAEELKVMRGNTR